MVQHLHHGVHDRPGATGQGGVVDRGAEDAGQRVGHQVRGRLVSRAQGEEHLPGDLLGAQPGRMVQEPARQIVAAQLGLRGNEFEDVAAELRLALGRLGTALHHHAQRPVQPLALAVGQPEQAVEDQGHQRPGELAHQIGLSARPDPAHQHMHRPVHPRAQVVRLDPLEGVDQRGTVADVRRAVREKGVGPPAHHPEDRRVLGDRRLPRPGIVREGVGVPQQLQRRSPLGDDVRRYARGEFGPADRALRAQGGVVAVGVAREGVLPQADGLDG